MSPITVAMSLSNAIIHSNDPSEISKLPTQMMMMMIEPTSEGFEAFLSSPTLSTCCSSEEHDDDESDSSSSSTTLDIISWYEDGLQESEGFEAFMPESPRSALHIDRVIFDAKRADIESRNDEKRRNNALTSSQNRYEFTTSESFSPRRTENSSLAAISRIISSEDRTRDEEDNNTFASTLNMEWSQTVDDATNSETTIEEDVLFGLPLVVADSEDLTFLAWDDDDDNDEDALSDVPYQRLRA